METRQPKYYYKQNRLQQLRGFYYVVVTGSFTAAAHKMGLEQPSVTLQVQALERELKARLFERKRGTLVLTTDGEALFELATPIVQGLESIDDAFEDKLERERTGRVVCVASEDIAPHQLPHLLHSFAATYPDVEVVMHSSYAYSALDILLRGEAEFAIAAPLDLPHGIHSEQLVAYDNYLVASKAHSLAEKPTAVLGELTKYPFIAPVAEGPLWLRLHQALEQQQLQCRIRMRLASTTARFRCVEAGLGVTVAVGTWLHSKLAPDLTWISLAEALPPTRYGVMYRKDAYLSWGAKRLIEFIMDSAPMLRSLPGAAAEQ